MITRAAINASQSYEFFPTVYTTLDGTIKVAHAVDPLASKSGKPFWAGIYGGKPDPALNLPLRFVQDGAWLRALVERLTNAHEASRPLPWKIDDAPPPYVEKMLSMIVGFEFSIAALTGKWKLSASWGEFYDTMKYELARSSFGGTFCNPYDTEREPGMSSAGSATSVAANLVTCAIGEETVVSIRWPAALNSLVGLAPTQELMSRDGMMGAGLNMRVGPLCRNVQDAAKILDVIAGYDPKDEMTVFSIGRMPSCSYCQATRPASSLLSS